MKWYTTACSREQYNCCQQIYRNTALLNRGNVHSFCQQIEQTSLCQLGQKFFFLSLSLFVRSQSERKTRQHEVFKGKPGSVNNKFGYVFIISLPILYNGSHSSSVPYCLTQQKMHFWNEVWQHWSWSGDATFKVCFAHWYGCSRCRCTSLRVHQHQACT